MKNKKKIIRVITRLNIGGPAIHAVLLSQAFSNESFSTYLVTGSPDPGEGDMTYLAREKNISPKYLPELKRKIGFSDIKAFFTLYKLMKKEKPDIVHTHTAKAGALGRLAAFFAHVPVKIHTFHGHVFDGYFNPIETKIFSIIERILSSITTRIIAVSDKIKRELVEDFRIVPPKKCSVIKLGFELDKFFECGKHKSIFKKQNNISDSTIIVGIVGRLVPVKNHEMFFEAIDELLKDSSMQEVTFVVIGDGERAEYLKNYVVKKGLKDKIIFKGWQKNIEKIYADLDIVALTSLNEGTPVSLIEAMACGKPVIATDVGGVGDIVREEFNGLLVKSGNVKEFSDKLKILIKNKEKRLKLGENGKVFARNTYNKERLISDMESLYKSCFSRHFKDKGEINS